MKFLYWCVGVFQILTGFMLAYSTNPGWRWVWILAALYWSFVGLVMAAMVLGKLMGRKFRTAESQHDFGGVHFAAGGKKEE